jgi:hypothetical protein
MKYKQKEEDNNKICEPMDMTYGMSEQLVNSGLLTQIHDLSTEDKQCLLRYISEEVELESLEEDEWDRQDTSNLEPYTLEELYARIEESHQQYLRGEYVTEAEVREEMRKEFAWLQ